MDGLIQQVEKIRYSLGQLSVRKFCNDHLGFISDAGYGKLLQGSLPNRATRILLEQFVTNNKHLL